MYLIYTEIKDNRSIFTIGTTYITSVMGREMRWGGGGYGRRGGGLSGPCGQQSAASEVRTPAPPPRICRYPSQSVETHHVYNQCRSFRIIRDTMDLPDSSRHTGYGTRLSEIILV